MLENWLKVTKIEISSKELKQLFIKDAMFTPILPAFLNEHSVSEHNEIEEKGNEYVKAHKDILSRCL